MYKIIIGFMMVISVALLGCDGASVAELASLALVVDEYMDDEQPEEKVVYVNYNDDEDDEPIFNIYSHEIYLVDMECYNDSGSVVGCSVKTTAPDLCVGDYVVYLVNYVNDNLNTFSGQYEITEPDGFVENSGINIIDWSEKETNPGSLYTKSPHYLSIPGNYQVDFWIYNTRSVETDVYTFDFTANHCD